MHTQHAALRRRSNIPAPVEAMIGRDAETIALRDLLTDQDVRLVTLTGSGGMGKTRLAQHVAAELLDDFQHGVIFVPLASVADPELVIPTIAQILGLADIGGRPLTDRLNAYLRDRALLLVLDNFEHLLPGAPAVSDLLAAAAPLKVLVTSRARLRLRGEHVVALSGLSLPDSDHPTRADLGRYGATRLFLDRAAAASSDFAIDEATAPPIAAICRRLDGVPLAIELAATRTRLLSPAALLAHVESTLGALPLLVGGARDLPVRHQSLRAAIGWSYDLLDPDERRLFQRIAVFEGGCTREVVQALYEQLGGGPFDALPGLGALVDQSLLRREQTLRSGMPIGAAPRFRMLETVRTFARECLATNVEAGAIRRTHAQLYLALAEDAAPNLTTAAQALWLEWLDLEQENLRAALTWSLDNGEAEVALRLAGALWRFWYMRGYLTEGRRWLDRVLAADCGAPTTARARALAGAGILACYQSNQARAVTLCSESRAICLALGDRNGVATALTGLALVARMGGDYPAASSLYREILGIQRDLGDTWGVAYALTYLGIAAAMHGDTAEARRPIEEGLALFRQSGDQIGTARALTIFSEIARTEGDVPAAHASATEALAIMRELGDRVGATRALFHLAEVASLRSDHAEARRLHGECALALCELGDATMLAPCLESLAWSVAALGRSGSASTILGAADALRERSPGATQPLYRAQLDRTVAVARAALGDAEFEAAWSQGRALTPEQAVACALAEPARTSSSAVSPLTRREREVATLVARGASNRQIASELVIAERTAERHVENMLAKLGLQSRTQVALWAVQHGIVKPSDA
jgi:predicted ATPase/DNA-binding CsgD family transcriptional regulator